MRNRLLPLAVLAIALGLAAAAYADISVTTVIQGSLDQQTGIGNWSTSARLWSDDGIGVGALSAGMYDYIIGVNGDGVAAVTSSVNDAPKSIPSQVGFWQPGAVNGTVVGGNVKNIAGWQNALVSNTGVLANCGIAPGSNAYGTWAPDMQIAHGTYTGAGTLSVAVPGRIGFSTLPTNGQGGIGTMTTLNAASWVSAVVTQTITGTTGNDGGGAAYTSPTATTVQAGSLRMGPNSQMAGMGQNLTFNIDSSKGRAGYQEDATVALDADLSVKALNINFGQSKLNGLDLNSYALKIYGADTTGQGGDLEGLASNLMTGPLSNAAWTTPFDGIYDSSIHDPSMGTIGVMPTVDDNNVPILLVKAVQWGDVNMDGYVDGIDMSIAAANWAVDGSPFPSAWWLGDVNGDGYIDGVDMSVMAANWNVDGLPWNLSDHQGKLGVVPEPCTLVLLAAGVVGLVRRRRAA